MSHEQLPTRTRATTPTLPTTRAPGTGGPSSPVPLPVIRRTGGGGTGGTTGGGTTATTTTTPPPESTLMPQTGTAYTLPEALAELRKYHHLMKDASKFSNKGRVRIATSWANYIFANHLTSLKAGNVRGTYKSKYDHGHADEFSVSQEIDGIPDIVIHAHMDEHGAPKGGNGVHWKWSDAKGELMPETYEMDSAHVTALLDDAEAANDWTTTGKAKYLATVTLPTVGTTTPSSGGTGGGTGGTGGSTGGGTLTTPTVTLPTTGTTP